MTVITETEKSLYLATADADVARVITDALPDLYDVCLYKDINGLFNALKQQTAELVLCHQFLIRLSVNSKSSARIAEFW